MLPMYKGKPLYGDKPNIAIDLFDNSLTNLVPSYLTHKLNDKIMNHLTDRSCTMKLSEDGRTITAVYDDGGKEVMSVSEDGTKITVSTYGKNSLLLGTTVTTVNPKTNEIRTDVSYDGSVNGVVDFATATWEEIGVMLSRHYSGIINLADFWHVGDTKVITREPMSGGIYESHNGAEQKIVIMGFDHDTLSSGGKAAISLGFLNGLGRPGFMNKTNTNVGGWAACNRRDWCNNVLLYSLPNELQSLIKTVDKLTSVGNETSAIRTTQDKCFLASETEIFGTLASHGFGGEGFQYPFFAGGDAFKKRQNDNVAGYDNWLTRSPVKSNDTDYVYVESDGHIGECDANSLYQIVPMFCI